MTRAYLFKVLHSPRTYIGIIGVFAICFTNFFNKWANTGDIVGQISSFLSMDTYRKAISIFAALPFAANFADEWKSRTAEYCVIRRGVKRYAVSNMIFCTLMAYLTVFVGMMLFSAFLSIFTPVCMSDSCADLLNGEFITNGMPIVYVMLNIHTFAASCAMWCAMGIMISVFFPNKFVAVCAPFVASYIVERITIQLPAEFNLWYLSLCVVPVKMQSNPTGAFFYTLMVFSVITVLCGVVFYIILRKRVQNEIV